MNTRESRFLDKNGITSSNIMYITRDGRKTVFYLSNGKKVETFYAIKGFLELLPQEMFEIINKGVVISSRYVTSVTNNAYTMQDGATFKGRVRTTASQKSNAIKYNARDAYDFAKQFAILDALQVGFCVIELTFEETSHDINFIFRYCNPEMAAIENRTVEEMLNKSFYDLYKEGNKKWLVTYADVAINGTKRVIEEYSPILEKNVKVYCFQPKPNFCACLLIEM